MVSVLAGGLDRDLDAVCRQNDPVSRGPQCEAQDPPKDVIVRRSRVDIPTPKSIARRVFIDERAFADGVDDPPGHAWNDITKSGTGSSGFRTALKPSPTPKDGLRKTLCVNFRLVDVIHRELFLADLVHVAGFMSQDQKNLFFPALHLYERDFFRHGGVWVLHPIGVRKVAPAEGEFDAAAPSRTPGKMPGVFRV